MTSYEISKYLKFGFTESFHYNDPYEIKEISFESAVRGYEFYYENEIYKINFDECLCALSGGLDSSLNIYHGKDTNPLVYSYIIEGNTDHIYAKRLSEYWRLKHFFLINSDIPSLEQSLIDMNKLWPTPRCVTGDLHTYDAYTKSVKFKSTILSGVGSEPMSLGIGWMYSPIIALATYRKEYDHKRAMNVFESSKYFDPLYKSQFNAIEIMRVRNKTYSQIIKEIFEVGLFTDKQIKELGIIPYEFELREDTLSHALQCTYDWYNPNLIGKRYPILEEKIKLKTLTPYSNYDFKQFCFSLPYEYRFCLGSERHVMRNYISNKLPRFILERNKEAFQPSIDWFFSNSIEIDSLFKTYLYDVNKRIYNYLDFDSLKIMFESFNSYQKWSLLNLSIWLDNNE